MKNLDILDIIFIIDQSGSMFSLTDSTINGFNSFLEEQQKEKGKAYLTLILFNTTCNIIYNRVDIREVEPLTHKTYVPNGCTALYDAIGLALEKEELVLNDTKLSEMPHKVLVNIITDGLENASREYSAKIINRKINELKEKDWSFSFIGAEIDSFKEGSSIGIQKQDICSFTHSNVGVNSVYNTLSRDISNYRQQAYCCSVSSNNNAQTPTYTHSWQNVK